MHNCSNFTFTLHTENCIRKYDCSLLSLQRIVNGWPQSLHWKRNGTPLACSVFNIIEDFKAHLKAGITKSSFGPRTDQHLEALPVPERRKAIKSFQEVFKLSFEKLDKHLSALPAYNFYKSVRLFDP